MKKDKRLFAEKILEKDIKYRGPLTYRGLRIIGWIAMTFFVITIFLGMGYSILTFLDKTEAAKRLDTATEIFSYIAVLPLPLFILANFGIIISNRHQYKKIIIKFAALAAIVFFGFLFVYYRYFYLLADKLASASEDVSTQDVLAELMLLFFKRKIAFNVFIDLLLCTLVAFFVNYQPTKYFKGKKIYIFRAMVAIPILYEVAAVLIKAFHNVYYEIHPIASTLLPTKPILLFFLFIGLILAMKIQEKRMLKKGMTIGDYHKYMKTNGSSLTFSISVSVGLLIVSIIDLLITVLVIKSNVLTIETALIFENIGLGDSICVFFAIPIIMLYSYNKKPKDQHPAVDIMIPVVGIGLVAIGVIEGVFAILMSL